MASAPAPSLASTKKTTNYARLCRLLVDVGSQALRDTFDRIHPPAGLHLVLAPGTPEHGTLQSLRKKRILNATQWGELYPTIPTSVTSARFDITLLMVLLRNICHLTPPVTGWDNIPSATDTSTEANIARVKYFRNTVYGHASQASVDDATFNSKWPDISNALMALGGASYGAAINKLKNECMDPDTEEHYRELLKEWKRDEDSIKEKLEEMEEVLKQVKEEKGSTKDKLGQVEENLTETLEQMGNQVKNVSEKLDTLNESRQDEEKTRNDLQQMKSMIGDISDKLDTVTAQRESEDEDKTRDDLKEMARDIRTISEKLKSQMTSGEEDKSRNDFQQMKSEIANISEKLDTLMAQRQTDDEDKTRDDFKEIKRDIRTISEKLTSQMTSGEEEPFAIRQPAGAVPVGRMRGGVSGATASTHDSGDSTGVRSTLKRKHSDPDTERENLKKTLEQMRNQVKKLESLLDEDKLQQLKSEIANMHEKLDTLVAQRETREDEDNTRDDFKKMARDIRTISEKLKSQVTLGEEGNSRDDLEQMKTKIADIKETLDTLMNPLPLEEKKQKMEVDERVIWNAAITFEAEHEECVRVLPYFQNGDVEIHLYVYNDRSGIPTELKNAAQAFFGQKRWKLIWADLYNDAFNLLKITSIEYSSGKPKRLEASQVDEIDEIINKHLHVFSKHRNVTAVQPSFKVTNSVQTQEACIVVYVLGKGQIPLGESSIPDTIGSYPVDIVNGFCVRTNDPYLPTEAHEQKEFLRLGASIGVNGKESSGSLGAIVEDVNRGTLYALSCDHVMNNADEKKIIHPGLDVYLNYLRYHLGEYKGWVERTIRPSVELPTFPDHTLEETELQNMFSDLKILKENYIASGIRRVSESRLNQIQLYEDKLEEAFRKRPRVIGKYLAGVRYNVKLETNSGKEHFIDAAISELNEDEVEKVKAEGEVEIIGTNHYPNGECLSATAVVNDLFKSGSATGFTRSNRLADELGNRPTYIRGQGNGRWIDVECINCSKTGPAQSQARDVLSPCEQCKTERWLKRCLCIQQQGAKPFSDIGDSGAVIFEERGNEKLAAPGFAIIFAELPTQYYKFAVALPLEIALEALSKEVSKLRPNSSKPCQLKLASKF